SHERRTSPCRNPTFRRRLSFVHLSPRNRSHQPLRFWRRPSLTWSSQAERFQRHFSLLHWLQNSGQVCPLVFPAAFRFDHLALHASMAGVAPKEGNAIEAASNAIGNVRIADLLSWSPPKGHF